MINTIGWLLTLAAFLCVRQAFQMGEGGVLMMIPAFFAAWVAVGCFIGGTLVGRWKWLGIAGLVVWAIAAATWLTAAHW